MSRATCIEPLLTLLPGEKKEVAAQPEPACAGKTAKKQKRTGKRTRTADEHACWRKFIDVWCNVIWPKHAGGEVYDMAKGDADNQNRNFRCVWGILDFVGMDFDKAVGAANGFAKTFHDSGWRFPCPLNMLRRDMLKWVNHFKLFGDSGNVNATLNTARPGEFVESLPLGVRSYPSQSKGIAAAG